MKVYGCPVQCPCPEPDYSSGFDREKLEAAEVAHTAALKKYLQENGWTGMYTGEIVRFAHADGYAQYMMAHGPTSCLIHLSYGDGWNSPMAAMITKKDAIDQIWRNRGMTEMFAKKPDPTPSPKP